MHILVTGANGQLGREMRLTAVGTAHNYYFTDIVADGDTLQLDITDAAAIRSFVVDNHIDVIVNCAAYTNVDAAESNQPMAMLLNGTAPGYLAQAMAEVNGLFVHISTDYVFGGDPYNTPCREDQKGTPTGVYGQTKLVGEQAVEASGCKHVIIRTAWLYSEFGRNFCKTMLQLTATRPRLSVVFDQTGTPTYALDLARAIQHILADYEPSATATSYSHSGIYHYSNEGVCSWYDFTQLIARLPGHHSCDIQPCHSDEYPSPVKRPAYSVLDKTKIKDTFGIRIPYWTESLRICLENIKQTS